MTAPAGHTDLRLGIVRAVKSWRAVCGVVAAVLRCGSAWAAPQDTPHGIGDARDPAAALSSTPEVDAGSPAPAAASGGSPAPGSAPAPEPAANHPASPKRALPDYSGRGPEPRSTAGEIALWVPRVILSPLYFVNEFVLRRPLSAIVPPIEKAQIPRKVYDFFIFGVDHKAGIVPVGFIDFNFNPSVGLYAFWDDALFSGHDLVLHAEFWPTDWIAGMFSERFRGSGGRSLTLKVTGIQRPDHMFFGIGPSSIQNHRSRYGADTVDASATFSKVFWRASRIDAAIGVRDVRTYNGHYYQDYNLQRAASIGDYPIPYGFEEQYTLAYSRLVAAFDNRRPYPFPGSGVRLEGQVEQDSAWNPSPGSEWIRYGAMAGGFWDVNGYRRVLSLTVAAFFADPIGSQQIPFTELVTLGENPFNQLWTPGGDGFLRGFFPGRLVDRSAALATIRYTWPVGPWVDADVSLSAGNVFGVHLDEFRAGLIRLSGTFGFLLSAMRGPPVELLIGAGTETFDNKAQLNLVRASVGVNRF
ncbi:MAG TPA: hypothetical protein VEK07_06675 [Polyangiaceae bacterium]|nr:hypothetical protein [Polyangiaceae bacterium]